MDDGVLTPDFHVLVICAWQLAFFLPHLLIIPMQVHITLWWASFLFGNSLSPQCATHVGAFAHWVDYPRLADPGIPYCWLTVSVNCEIRLFVGPFQSTDRLFLPCPGPGREMNPAQCFFMQWTHGGYWVELSHLLMSSRQCYLFF